MRKISIAFLFTVLFLQASAGGWLKGKNNGFFKLSQTVIKGSQFFNGEGKKSDIITTGVYQTSIYGEYGISNSLDLIGYLPFASRITLNDVQFSSGKFQEGDEITSVGDAELGLKWGIRRDKPLVISATLYLGLPFGNAGGGETGLLQTGDGEFNQMLLFDVGYGFKFPLYANLGLGFNNRTKDFSEEFIATAELGYELKKKLIVALKFKTVQSFMNGEPDGSSGNGIFSNNLEYVSFGPELSYKFSPKFGITGSYATASSGRYVLAEPSYSIGLFLDIK